MYLQTRLPSGQESIEALQASEETLSGPHTGAYTLYTLLHSNNLNIGCWKWQFRKGGALPVQGNPVIATKRSNLQSDLQKGGEKLFYKGAWAEGQHRY